LAKGCIAATQPVGEKIQMSVASLKAAQELENLEIIPLKSCPFLCWGGRSGPNLIDGFLGPHEYDLNGISVSSAIFAQHELVLNTLYTD